MSQPAAFVFDSKKVQQGKAFEVYRELYSAGSEASALGDDFSARLTARRVGQMVMFERFINQVAHERSETRVRHDDIEHVILQLNVGGQFDVETPFGRHNVLPGQVVLFDLTLPQRTQSHHAHILTFSVPRTFVEGGSGDLSHLHGRVLDGLHAPLLANTMNMMVRHAPALVGDHQNRLASAFREILAIAVPSPDRNRQRSDVSGSKRLRILIENNLNHPQLSPEWLSRQAGLSRTRIYEIFQPSGGVSRYIQHRRATRLRALLLQPSTARASVATLAFAAGFSNESHATRVFREQFGMPPGQFRRDHQSMGEASEPTPSGFADWLHAID